AATGEAAAARLQRFEPRGWNQSLQGDAAVAPQHVHPFEFGRTFDDALGERETQRKVLEVAGCRHHDREWHAVVNQRDGGFLDHPVEVLFPAVLADALRVGRRQASAWLDRTHRAPEPCPPWFPGSIGGSFGDAR